MHRVRPDLTGAVDPRQHRPADRPGGRGRVRRHHPRGGRAQPARLRDAWTLPGRGHRPGAGTCAGGARHRVPGVGRRDASCGCTRSTTTPRDSQRSRSVRCSPPSTRRTAPRWVPSPRCRWSAAPAHRPEPPRRFGPRRAAGGGRHRPGARGHPRGPRPRLLDGRRAAGALGSAVGRGGVMRVLLVRADSTPDDDGREPSRTRPRRDGASRSSRWRPARIRGARSRARALLDAAATPQAWLILTSAAGVRALVSLLGADDARHGIARALDARRALRCRRPDVGASPRRPRRRDVLVPERAHTASALLDALRLRRPGHARCCRAAPSATRCCRARSRRAGGRSSAGSSTRRPPSSTPPAAAHGPARRGVRRPRAPLTVGRPGGVAHWPARCRRARRSSPADRPRP